LHEDRKKLGWEIADIPAWLAQANVSAENYGVSERWQHSSDILMSGQRCFNVFEERCKKNALTFYMSERWFKPPFGMFRLLHPKYFWMAFRFCRLLCSPSFYYLPIGIYAANDIWRMAKLFAFLPRCLFQRPPLTTLILQSKMLLWGYFVEPASNLKEEDDEEISSKGLMAQRVENKDAMCEERDASRVFCMKLPAAGILNSEPTNSSTNELLNVLWVGRMLDWKRVDTLIKAVGLLLEEGYAIRLVVVGQGPEEPRLRKLAETICNRNLVAYNRTTNELSPITFQPPVPIVQVRDLMRQADVYVLPSDGGEGWGAVVNEAMEEGCSVIATWECGSGSTIIKHGENGLLFHAGNVDDLAGCLRQVSDDANYRLMLANAGQETIKSLWSSEVAAERLRSFCEALLAGRNVPVYADGPLRNLPC
jgi:glycosyltransferase involved in cell wall biosynthesis